MRDVTSVEDSYDAWEKVRDKVDYWRPLTDGEYNAKLKRRDADFWAPGPMGIQSAHGIHGDFVYGGEYTGNVTFYHDAFRTALTNTSMLWGDFMNVQEQKHPYLDHYRRSLSWVDLGLWDFAGENKKENKEFLQKLYGLNAHPLGYWRAESIFPFDAGITEKFPWE